MKLNISHFISNNMTKQPGLSELNKISPNIIRDDLKKKLMADTQKDETNDTGENKTDDDPHKIQVTVKKWHAVALWSWDTKQDTCAICRNMLMELCISCQVKGDQQDGGPGVCSMAWGVCTHNFHFHCIVGWIDQYNSCPLCGGEWDFQKKPF